MPFAPVHSQVTNSYLKPGYKKPYHPRGAGVWVAGVPVGRRSTTTFSSPPPQFQSTWANRRGPQAGGHPMVPIVQHTPPQRDGRSTPPLMEAHVRRDRTRCSGPGRCASIREWALVWLHTFPRASHVLVLYSQGKLVFFCVKMTNLINKQRGFLNFFPFLIFPGGI